MEEPIFARQDRLSKTWSMPGSVLNWRPERLYPVGVHRQRPGILRPGFCILGTYGGWFSFFPFVPQFSDWYSGDEGGGFSFQL